MTEEYRLCKDFENVGVSIDITVADRDLLLKLDDVIFNTIVDFYHLNAERR